MADKAHDTEAAAREAVKKQASTREAQDAQRALNAGKPTPTQEENDLAKLGAPAEKHEEDGSPQQPLEPPKDPYSKRSMEGQSGAGYQTRGTAKT